MEDIPIPWLPTGAKYIFVCELLYVASTCITKISLGVYFLRLASPKAPYQAKIIYFNMATVTVYSIVYFFFLILQCRPVNYLWDQYSDGIDRIPGGGTCLSKDILINATYAHAAMSAITDWTFGVLPVAFVWGMKMNPKTKFSVVLVLSLGFL
jgi:hypothetical protein